MIFWIFLLIKNYVSSPQSTSSESQLTLFAPLAGTSQLPNPHHMGAGDPAAHRPWQPEPHPSPHSRATEPALFPLSQEEGTKN